MDGNKDAALKCMSIGQKALQDGDRSRAYKFLAKARRLDPSLPLEELLSTLLKDNTEEAVGDRDFRMPDNKNESEKNLGTEVSGSNTETNSQHRQSKAGPAYTTEQADIVLRIRKTKDYYQILGLTKECSAEEIRKAYRKVSLKVHPDKNKAPGAEEAFKAVSKSFACLSDEELRKRYDQYGPEETPQHYARRSNGFHEEMFDADEIFNAFFFGTPYANSGFQRAHFVRTYGTTGQGGGGGVRTGEAHFGRLFGLLQILPILALFLISFLPSREPVYSLEQVAPYQYRQVTRGNGVPFFVKSQTFETDYPAGGTSRRSIEVGVERDYREILARNCQTELGRRYWNPSAKTPYCDRLNRFTVI
eukprot:c28562_g1_i1 orf=138-1223(+)